MAIPGLVLGVVIGSSGTIRAALEPVVNGLWTVPKLALLSLPLFFGPGEMPGVGAGHGGRRVRRRQGRCGVLHLQFMELFATDRMSVGIITVALLGGT